jgi:methyl-accepting chemotaxis protein
MPFAVIAEEVRRVGRTSAITHEIRDHDMSSPGG